MNKLLKGKTDMLEIRSKKFQKKAKGRKTPNYLDA